MSFINSAEQYLVEANDSYKIPYILADAMIEGARRKVHNVPSEELYQYITTLKLQPNDKEPEYILEDVVKELGNDADFLFELSRLIDSHIKMTASNLFGNAES